MCFEWTEPSFRAVSGWGFICKLLFTTSSLLILQTQNYWKSQMCLYLKYFMNPNLNSRRTQRTDSVLTISQVGQRAISVAWSPARNYFNVTISTSSSENRLVQSPQLQPDSMWPAQVIYIHSFIHFYFFLFDSWASYKEKDQDAVSL